MIWLWFYGVATACLLIAVAPSSTNQQSDLATAGLTVITASTAFASLGYIGVCLVEFFVETGRARESGLEDGKKEGKTDGGNMGQAEGIQEAEKECTKIISDRNAEIKVKCELEATEVRDAVMQEALADLQSEIDVNVGGFQVNLANTFAACTVRSPCTSDADAECISQNVAGTVLCIPKKLVE
ncbi:uncharacterized protein LOC133191996 [Saccostrea echinata]|uniref:uncharacterized protein LOC133191996 n=1 Tax=Saccostrea echinata TaxID=191078 RepID=UPI002A81A4BF|nr:uncharacterized protein LOC133191996 [Saccostrea echinata]